MTINAFLQAPIRMLADTYRIYIVCNGQARDIAMQLSPCVTVLPVAIERQITPAGDIAALWHLFWLMRRHRFDIVHSITPKAGLLAMTAAWLAGIQIRVHTFTGQVWVTKTGFSRMLLKTLDQVIARLASRLLVDSRSQLQFLLDEGVLPKNKAAVLGKGSVSGVDTDRFIPDARARARVRAEVGIPEVAIVFLFLGRLNPDKGLLDLAGAFELLARDDLSAHLLVVGPDESGMESAMSVCMREHAERVHFVGHTDRPEAYMAAADVFCLPSYREGFGNVIIEAAAAGLPAIGSRIYGISDAIDDGKTGLLHPPGDIAAIHACMSTFAASPERIATMGRQARTRAVSDFASPALVRAWLAFYRKLQ